MNRQTRLLIVIAIAVVTAAAASFVLYLALVRSQANPLAEVVVARRALQTGAKLTASDVQVIRWPRDFQVPGTKGSVKDVLDRCLRVAVSENDPIVESKLALPNECGLTPTITNGMLAMSVKVNEVVGVAGFVVPGTHVDVIVTLRQERESISRVVVRNVQVLTAGSTYDEAQAQQNGKPITSSVVTLMVTPEEAQKIALASSEGQVTLALRNPQDSNKELPDSTNVPDIMKSAKPQPAPSPAPKAKAAPPPRLAVRVTSPQSGASLSALVELSANVTNATEPVTVQWRVDGADIGASRTEAPYAAQWDTTKMPKGSHRVTAVARDGARKTATSSITVGVAQPCKVVTFKQGKREELSCP